MRQIHLTTDDDYKKNLRQNIDKLVLDGKWVPIEDKTLVSAELDHHLLPRHRIYHLHSIFIYRKL